jgi:hypothetical protein
MINNKRECQNGIATIQQVHKGTAPGGRAACDRGWPVGRRSGDAAVAAQIDAGELGAGLKSRKAGAPRRKPPAADRCGDGAIAGEAGTGHGSDGAGHIKKAAAYFAKESLHGSVSASGLNASRSRGPSRRAQQEARLEIEIRAAHQRTRQTYGPERLQRDLAAHGVRIGVHRIGRLRRKLGLRCKQRRKFKVTTDSGHRLPVAENLLDYRFQSETPLRAWFSDMTYVPTDEGWLYLVGHKDLCSRKIVGYAIGESMSRNLVIESLLRAVPVEGLPCSGFVSKTI